MVALRLEEPLFDRRTVALTFKVDIMRVFKGTNIIDMSTLFNVKFDRADARLIADNYETMILSVRPARLLTGGALHGVGA